MRRAVAISLLVLGVAAAGLSVFQFVQRSGGPPPASEASSPSFASGDASADADTPGRSPLGPLGAVAAVVLLGAGLALLLSRRSPLELIKTLDRGISLAESAVVVGGLVLMLGLYFLNVVFRNVSASFGEKWLGELPLQLVVWVALFGMSVAAREGRHIAIDIAPRVLPKAALRWVRVVTSGASFAMCVLLSVAGWRYLTQVALAGQAGDQVLAITFGKTVFLTVPSWIFIAVVPLAFGLTAWHFLVVMIREVVDDSPFPDESEDSPEAVLAEALLAERTRSAGEEVAL